MKILCTGHRGNLGRVLNQLLLQRGHEVLGVDIKDGVDCADITNLDSFRGVSHVFHLAAHIRYPKKNTMDAVDTMIEFCKRENAKMIYASSAAIYNPTSLYAVHKLYGEVAVRTELPNPAILRIFNIYGGQGIGLIDKIDRYEKVRVNGNGDQERDYVHINDVAEAFATALERDLVGTVDIGTGESHSVNDVLEYVGYTDYEYVAGDGGIPTSVATLNQAFPWKAQQSLYLYLHEKARLAPASQ